MAIRHCEAGAKRVAGRVGVPGDHAIARSVAGELHSVSSVTTIARARARENATVCLPRTDGYGPPVFPTP